MDEVAEAVEDALRAFPSRLNVDLKRRELENQTEGSLVLVEGTWWMSEESASPWAARFELTSLELEHGEGRVAMPEELSIETQLDEAHLKTLGSSRLKGRTISTPVRGGVFGAVAGYEVGSLVISPIAFFMVQPTGDGIPADEPLLG